MTSRLRNVLAGALLLSGTAHAWEPETHAGLTQQAAPSSYLHRALLANGRPLGLFDTFRLAPASREAGKNSIDEDELLRRLGLLDHEGGYGSSEWRMTAMGWLTAGSVVEDAPVERQRHHFAAPAGSAVAEESFGNRVSRWHDGLDSLRGFIAGGAARKYPAPEWLTAERSVNAWGLERYLDERERAATLPTLAERNDAWARALLAAGAIVHLVEDAGEPAHARGDLAPAPAGAPSLAHWVAEKFGRTGVPESDVEGAQPERWAGFWHDPTTPDAALGDLAAQLYSPGTLPAANSDVAPKPASGYLAGRVPHLLAYQRRDGLVDYVIDARCFRDYAALLLPRTVQAAHAALDRLFHGDVELALDGGDVVVKPADVPWGKGTVSLLIDHANGQRQLLSSSVISDGALGATVLRFKAPADGELRLTALYRGLDSKGEPLVVSRELLLSRKGD